MSGYFHQSYFFLPCLESDTASESTVGVTSSDSQSMWGKDITSVELIKGDRGLGFSILDYQVRQKYVFNKSPISDFGVILTDKLMKKKICAHFFIRNLGRTSVLNVS